MSALPPTVARELRDGADTPANRVRRARLRSQAMADAWQAERRAKDSLAGRLQQWLRNNLKPFAAGAAFGFLGSALLRAAQVNDEPPSVPDNDNDADIDEGA